MILGVVIGAAVILICMIMLLIGINATEEAIKGFKERY